MVLDSCSGVARAGWAGTEEISNEWGAQIIEYHGQEPHEIPFRDGADLITDYVSARASRAGSPKPHLGKSRTSGCLLEIAVVENSYKIHM